MKLYVKIDGMHCQHCVDKITNTLLKIKNVESVSIKGHTAIITYKDSVDKDEIRNKIDNLGYTVKDINDKHTSSKEIITFILIVFVLLLISKLLRFNPFNVIPTINTNIQLGMLFVVGLLTSIHCISMCGAFNILASNSKHKYKQPLLYNLGRLISYTIIGGIVGLLGSILTINIYIQGFILLIASLFMINMGLFMLGYPHLNLSFLKIKQVNTNRSFIIGLLNGFMPCGPLQAMQLYALSTASFLYGSLSLFLFVLGTIPLMLVMGIIVNTITKKGKMIIAKISAFLILILALGMLNRGLLAVGIDVTGIFNSYNNDIKSTIKEDYQYLEFNLKNNGYDDIVIQKGIPVKLVINVDEKSLTGCNNELVIEEYNIHKTLVIGKNIIEFTPNKTGKFFYTCWMQMLKNNITVIDNLNYFKEG